MTKSGTIRDNYSNATSAQNIMLLYYNLFAGTWLQHFIIDIFFFVESLNQGRRVGLQYTLLCGRFRSFFKENIMIIYIKTHMWISSLLPFYLVSYFRLFIVATGCLSERHAQNTVSCYGGIVQRYRTKLLRAPPGSLLTCSVYSTVTRDLGLKSYPSFLRIFASHLCRSMWEK